MPPSSKLTEKFEEERLRTQEQSQIVYLQGQIDELRRLIKDQTNKYQWAMEQARKTDATVAQVQSTFERYTQEVDQSVDRIQRDVLDIRREVASALVRIQESFEPIRQMQAQIQQIADSRKQDREESFGWISRIEELEQKILTLQSQIKESEEHYRQLTLQINHLREADNVAIEEARRVSEDLQVEKQSLRRQAIEAQQLVADVHNILEEHDSRISRIDQIRENIELFAQTLPEQIAAIDTRFPDIDVELKRIERVSTERFLMNQERLEELRQQEDEKISMLQEIEEQNTHQQASWLERIDRWLQELDQRMLRSVNRLEETQRNILANIASIEDRELQNLVIIEAAMRQRLDATKDAQATSIRPDQQKSGEK
jgi:DNA repair exonuclease SbcCD ATPase subunit